MNTKNVHIHEQTAETGTVKSAARVLDLLEFLAIAPEPAGVSEISRRLGIPKSSAYMLLATLEGRGYVVCDGGRRFELHPSLAGEGSWIGGLRGPLLRVARPVMYRLAESTGESVFLGVLRGDSRLEYIHKSLSPQDLRCDADLGVPRHLHSTSTGLVLLACVPEAANALFARGELARLTPRTICDAKRLRKEISLVAERGHAHVVDTNSPHASGVAAPIRVGGRVIAALNLAGPTARFDSTAASAARAVVAAAERISRELSRPLDTGAATTHGEE